MGIPDLTDWGADLDPALLEWPDFEEADWTIDHVDLSLDWFPDPEPETPPPKPAHKLHWRRRLAMLHAICEEYRQNPA